MRSTPMAYGPCPYCRAMNRAGDSHCYSCRQPMELTPAAGGRGFGDTPALRLVPGDRRGLLAGVGSGALAALVVGFASQVPVWMMREVGFLKQSYAQMGPGGVGGDSFVLGLVAWLVYGLVLGGLLLAQGVIGSPEDSSRLAAYPGVLLCIASLLWFDATFGAAAMAAFGSLLIGSLASKMATRIGAPG
ncbi:MAG: hypothetical protein HY319_21105 [Armatimonadetes bacterium]|nr:hypothetical protein [Armatimonadota bacterium]